MTHTTVRDAITRVVDGAGVDQLILYFSGHGVNNNNGERWLLSGAPDDASAAVDLAASVEMARYLVGLQRRSTVRVRTWTAHQRDPRHRPGGVPDRPSES